MFTEILKASPNNKASIIAFILKFRLIFFVRMLYTFIYQKPKSLVVWVGET